MNIQVQPHTLLYVAKSGSQLFGTQTPSSDLDLKGLFLPTRSSLYLQTAPSQFSFDTKSSGQERKNTADDVDATVWSVQMWLRLLEKGDLNAISLLFSHTHPDAVVESSSGFLEWLKNLEHTRLLSRKLSGMVGYVASQAVKYTDKGKHFRVVRLAFETLERASEPAKVQDVVDSLMARAGQELFPGWPDYLFVEKAASSGARTEDTFWHLAVLDKRYDLTASARWAAQSLKPLLERYGTRAREASSQGVDFKAFSHSLRVLEEVRELHTFGKLEYPHQPEFARFLTEVKTGVYPFEFLVEKLENLLLETDKAALGTVLPLEFDAAYAEGLVLELYGEGGFGLEGPPFNAFPANTPTFPRCCLEQNGT